ncbi:MAG: PfkB family carbohydrate kinase [Sphaerochaetaceae bacterium]
MKHDITMVGHISRDVLVDWQGKETIGIGGAVVYGSATIARSGFPVQVLTKLPASEKEIRKGLLLPKIDWVFQESPAITSIRNVFHTADKEKRDVSLLSRARSFRLDDIPDTIAPLFYLAGLFVDEIPDEFITAMETKAKIAVDAQGVVRRALLDGTMKSEEWPRKREMLPHITYFKVDAAEAEILTGSSDREKAARMLHDWGAKEVMLTFNTEVLICHGDGLLARAPYTNRNNSGRTGRGDTTFSAYLAWRKEHSVEESVRYAAALCSIKMEHPGVFTQRREDVLERMEKDAGK